MAKAIRGFTDEPIRTMCGLRWLSARQKEPSVPRVFTFQPAAGLVWAPTWRCGLPRNRPSSQVVWLGTVTWWLSKPNLFSKPMLLDAIERADESTRLRIGGAGVRISSGEPLTR